MSDNKSEIKPKKILDSSPVSGIAVPLAIVLVGGLIIWGVTQMLSTGRNHRDLVNEMHSKTFGNRWVAAYELSKYIASSSIPEKDIPWMVENLSELYQNSKVDPKTRNFTVMALGALNSKMAVETLLMAASDKDREVSFNAIVALGKIDGNLSHLDFSPVIAQLDSQDSGKVQVALMTLAERKHSGLDGLARKSLQNSSVTVRYIAAQVLISLGDSKLGTIVEEMINLTESEQLNAVQVANIKMNLINALGKNRSIETAGWLKKLEADSNEKISTKATQLLNNLKI